MKHLFGFNYRVFYEVGINVVNYQKLPSVEYPVCFPWGNPGTESVKNQLYCSSSFEHVEGDLINIVLSLLIST